MIPYGRQDVSEADILQVINVLRSDFLTQGPVVPKFEQAICDYVHASYGIAVNSATSALHIACLALGLGKGDVLWTTPITFVASSNCGLYCGAKVDFVDIDPVTWNLSPIALEEKLQWARQDNCLPKVLVVVHLCGLPCDMEAIHKLSKKYGFHIIEDASHAIGGKYKNQPIGNCDYSDITVFSFHPVKTMTTGEGGMAVTNQNELANKMQLLRSHGITRDSELMTHEPDGDWYYQQVSLGFNYRMTDLHAALGVSQLERLDGFVNRRHELAGFYNQQLSALPLQLPLFWSEECYSGAHLYVIRVLDNASAIDRGYLFSYLRDNGVGVNLHYIPIHTQPYYREMGFHQGDFPNAETYYQEALSLPLYPQLENADVKMISNLIISAFG